MSFRHINILFVLTLPALAASSDYAVPGINNFHAVDQQVYRGAQPTDEGFQYLSKLGVKVILDLREHDGRARAEERVVTADGMRYVNIPMTGLRPPSAADTDKILKLLEDSSAGPVFVHCKRGADRTGAVIAAYRIAHDKWDNARALKEAMSNGMRWMQFPRQKYISTFSVRLTEASDVRPAGSLANAN
jgi:tyrosine-protein phosphatase SIW14